MCSYKTNNDLLNYSSVAEAKLIQYVVDKIEDIKEVGYLGVPLNNKMNAFFKPKAKKGNTKSTKRNLKIDCDIKDADCRYIGEVAGANDLSSDPKYSSSHTAVYKVLEKNLFDEKVKTESIILKIMCQLLPVYLHYKLPNKKEVPVEENLICYFGSAKEDIVGVDRIELIRNATNFMVDQKWIHPSERVDCDETNYNLLIYEIKFCDSLVCLFEKSLILEEDFYILTYPKYLKKIAASDWF